MYYHLLSWTKNGNAKQYTDPVLTNRSTEVGQMRSNLRALSTSPFMYTVLFAMQLYSYPSAATVWRANLGIWSKDCLLNSTGFPAFPRLI